MKLYCITLFLNSEHLDAFVAACKKAGCEMKQDEVTDQVGESAHCWQINASGLHMVAGPANGFHRDLDYEIGITASSSEEWEQFDEGLKNADLDAERIHEEDGTDIIIPKVEHGPFFCMMDHSKSSEADQLIRFEATMTPDDLAVYENVLKPLFCSALTDKFSFTAGDSFKLTLLELTAGRILG
ncbi:MAG: hypothetical protein KBT02_10905 [Treponema sp.]|nr:hypothetical protein [Candidatus Treponema caballi]